jgi:hypothetical protein
MKNTENSADTEWSDNQTSLRVEIHIDHVDEGFARLSPKVGPHHAGSYGINDVEVTNQDGDVIAAFRGCSRSIRGSLFEE